MRSSVISPTFRRQALAAGVALAALIAAGQAMALPVLGAVPATVSAGGAQPIIQTGSTDVRIDLNAPRTIIDWSSFNLGAGERAEFRFDQRNWIALNRVTSGPININGQVVGYQAANLNAALPAQTSGNVWFYSPQGVAFGSSANVDVGGMLATSAAVNQAQFLNANNLQIGFTGSGSGGPVTAAGGSQFRGIGYMAFVAPQVSTGAGATVTLGDLGTAAYGAVDSYEITFLPANQDLTFFTFVVPNAAAGTPHATPLNLAGATTAANTYLMAISRSQVMGLLINAPGLLTGQSSINAYGQVTISTGRNIINGQIGPVENQIPGVTPGHVTLGDINAIGNVNIVTSGVGRFGDVTANRIRAGQALLISAHSLNVPGGITAGDTGVNLGGAVLDLTGLVTVPTLQARTNIFITPGAVQQGLATLQLGTVSSGTRIQIIADSLTVNAMTSPSIQSSTAGATTATSLIGSTEVLMAASTNMTLGTVQTGGLTRLTFEDLNLTGSVTANSAILRILTPDEAFLGGSGAGRRVSNAEFQRFRVSTFLSVFGGIDGQFPISVDLTVDDLDVDPTRVPELRLFAKNTHQVNIDGLVRPTAPGVVLKIGASDADSIWKPLAIGVLGGLGSAQGNALTGFTDVRAFDRVELVATKDIVFGGSLRFFDLVRDVPASQIDLGRDMPMGAGAVGEEIGRILLVAGSATMTASDRIIQQNTGALGQEGGFFLTGRGVGPTDPLLTVSPAQVVDLFGALQIGDGIVTTGSQASFSNRIALVGEPGAGAIRINGCAFGIGCATFTPATQFRVDQFRPAAPRAAIDPPVLTPPPPVDEDEREAESVITGTGNEEIWRRDR